ncbi:M60 family metallopeptidase [Pedobacter sp. Du54]|uniref:M60 family metallopeptidase n=1 Tax=Pedobacter anseongensis TaxID=3133439 RepID=UPI00309B1EE4
MKQLLILVLLASALPTFAQGVTKDPATVIIGPKNKLAANDTAFKKQISEWCNTNLAIKDYKKITAHPSAAYFPGAVKEGAKFIKRTITIKHQKIVDSLIPIVTRLRYSGNWANTLYSTGLYAVPGEYIEIDVPDGIDIKHLKVQIGSHSDRLNSRSAERQPWSRMPIITKVQELAKGKNRIASPFGGLIYITYPPREATWENEITIGHAVAAPLFILGKTTDDAWKSQLADSKAPWGELASDNMIITLANEDLQQVTNPSEVMKLWDLIVGGEMDLAQIKMPFYRAQRMVVDVQISAGAMHSGYPFMTYHSPSSSTNTVDVAANPAVLMKPSKGGANWGFFHELGHNMQNLDWVFGGSTEVSNNFFSLYMFDRLLGGRDDAHSAISSENTQKSMKKYFAEGVDYEKWKKDPFLGLIMFRQIQESFGWESFKTFFRAYQKFAEQDIRTPENQKPDVFVTTFSKVINRNLAPFFVKWGIPIREHTQKELAIYEGWMPYNFPPQN